MVYLVTGQPGSGKTTFGTALYEKLLSIGRDCVFIDGDNIRRMWPHIKYSDAERRKSNLLTMQVAQALNSDEQDVVVCIVCPQAKVRDQIHFFFVYVFTHCKLFCHVSSL